MVPCKASSGIHVIVKTHGDELPDRTFEEAARLAAYYSSMRGSDKVEIDYVEKKQVKNQMVGNLDLSSIIQITPW